MSSTFLKLRYIAFALFISFHSVICILAALNLGSLALNTARFPEVDSYLIFLGALGIVLVFSVIFVELIRKNAFIARVGAEIGWVAILWIMNLSGAAATTAITPTIQCSPLSREPKISCSSSKVLLAFTWLSCITLLSYLVGLVVCAVHHSQGDSRIWCNGVRDYRWFTQRRPVEDTAEKNLSYGRLVDPRELSGPPTIYAQQMGLARNYAIEPLRIETNIEPLRVNTTIEPLRVETTIERPVPPVPAASSASRAIPFGRDSYRFPRPTPPSTSVQSYSLYPQHLQATVGNLPVAPTRAGGPSPPPAGSWPRSNPQEPLRKRPPQMTASGLSANQPPAPVPLPSNPEMEEQGVPGGSLSSAARSRPSGPRTPASASRRPRPPPLDLSQVSSHNEPER